MLGCLLLLFLSLELVRVRGLEQVLFLVGAPLEEASCGNAVLFRMNLFSHVVAESRINLLRQHGTINFMMW